MLHQSIPSPKPRFRLAIIGGGIGGLALAVALGCYEDETSPIQVDLYEAGPEITTTGAGISVWPRTWAIMKHLGLYDQLSDEAVKSHQLSSDNEPKSAFVYRKSDWSRDGYDFGQVLVPNGSTTMHRAEMVDVFMRNLPTQCQIHTSKRLVKYTETSKKGTTIYRLHFADETTAEADVIIGADGIKSKTRAAMYDYAHSDECKSETRREECGRCRLATPRWTGIVTYRYLIPSEKLRAINPNHRVFDSPALLSHIVTYPISHGKYINWVGFVTKPEKEGTIYPQRWVTDASRDDVVGEYDGWEPEVEQMLKCVDNPTLWAIHVIDNLPFSVRNRVALIGDAVHAMTPHFGAGGGQAIEDAFILGRLLADRRATLSRIPGVFCIYQDVRLPFARNVVQNAGKVGHMYEFHWPGLYDGSPITEPASEEQLKSVIRQLDELGKTIQQMWEWQSQERVEDQWAEAETRFETMLKADSRRTWSDVEKCRWGCCIM